MEVFAGVSGWDADGSVRILSGVSFDVTEDQERRLRSQDIQAELREDLQRAHQRETVAQVAGGIAHDLNNHIGLVLWNLEKLEPLGESDAEIAESLNQMRRAIDMSRDLISGLDELVRPDIPRSGEDLGKLIPTAVELIGRPRAERHDVRVHLPEDVLPIWCNPTEILQVIVNLVINACDAGTKDNPATVEIAAMPRETDAPARHPDAGFLMRNNSEFVLFKITDTGTGITEDVRERIFQRNFTTKGSMGTGLGLPIVARILQDNRAALWVDTLPGSGTTMTVAWPSKPAVAEAARAAKLPQGIDLKVPIDPTLLKGLQALVVDDLPDVALVLASMLEAGGAEVYCETDPEFVKEVLADAPSDWSVLVTDLHMPGTDGAALARFAATLNPPVPVVLVTARTDTLDEVSLRDFAAVLQKPVSGAQLVNAVLRAAASQEGIRQERSSQGTSSD